MVVEVPYRSIRHVMLMKGEGKGLEGKQDVAKLKQNVPAAGDDGKDERVTFRLC